MIIGFAIQLSKIDYIDPPHVGIRKREKKATNHLSRRYFGTCTRPRVWYPHPKGKYPNHVVQFVGSRYPPFFLLVARLFLYGNYKCMISSDAVNNNLAMVYCFSDGSSLITISAVYTANFPTS